MPDSDPLINEIKQTLDGLQADAHTRQKLDQARHMALQQIGPEPLYRYAMPILALASLAVIALLITMSMPTQAPILDVDAIDAFEIITSRDDLEMYRELEFYLWLDEQNLG